MDNKKIERINRLSKIGSWLVWSWILLPLIAGLVLMFLNYFKLLPVDCSIGGWGENISQYYESNFLLFVGLIFSLLGFVIILIALFLSFVFKIPKKIPILSIIFFVISVFWFFVILPNIDSYPKSKIQLASTMADLSGFRTRAETYYDAVNQSYGPDTSSCDTPNTIFSQIEFIQGLGSLVDKIKGMGGSQIQCYLDKDRYALAVKVEQKNSVCRLTKYLCVDNNSGPKTVDGPISGPSCGD